MADRLLPHQPMMTASLALCCADCQQSGFSFRLELEYLTYVVRCLFGHTESSQGGQDHVIHNTEGRCIYLWHRQIASKLRA
jgi:hypothetical protein